MSFCPERMMLDSRCQVPTGTRVRRRQCQRGGAGGEPGGVDNNPSAMGAKWGRCESEEAAKAEVALSGGELESRRINSYGFAASYQVAHRHFVYRSPTAMTPPCLKRLGVHDGKVT